MDRECGDCSLCCKLLPMPEFNKPAGTRCQHQRHGIGCNIYPRRPTPCKLWQCRWLNGDKTGSRPDRAHYVVDIMPDFVTVVPKDGSDPMQVPVIQVWIDPAFPDAHRDKKLRRYIEEKEMPALIRLSAHQAFLLAPPTWSADGQWWEGESSLCAAKEHTAEERLAVTPIRIILEKL